MSTLEKHATPLHMAKLRCQAYHEEPLVIGDGMRGEAAILITIREREEDSELMTVITRRCSNMRSHAGECALPGGKRDPGDKSIEETALREAWEEIGLDPGTVEVWTKLHPMISKERLVVTPIVAQIPSDFEPNINEDEVESAFETPLREFLNPNRHSVRQSMWHGRSVGIHFFEFHMPNDKYVVWGLTASVLMEAASVAFDYRPPFIRDAQLAREHMRKVAASHTAQLDARALANDPAVGTRGKEVTQVPKNRQWKGRRQHQEGDTQDDKVQSRARRHKRRAKL
eukprot:Clim_evm4s239 gene=Clim_evmTU4s239